MRRAAVLLSAVLLAVVFLVACIPKIASPHDFAVAVFRYQVLPYGLINIAAVYLPWLELVTALALLAPGWRRGAALIVLLLLAVFAGAMTFNLLRGVNVSCGCFSVSDEAASSGWWNVVRNLVLMAAAWIVFRAPDSKGLTDRAE
jgi:uncharacterized membrane protein